LFALCLLTISFSSVVLPAPRIVLHGYNRSSTQVQEILDYISKNYMTQIALDDLVAEMGISRAHICHLVKKHTGKTVNQHIRTMRLQKACEMLKNTTLDYSDMAYELGFTDQSYFIKQFRETMGVTPKKYRDGVGGICSFSERIGSKASQSGR